MSGKDPAGAAIAKDAPAALERKADADWWRMALLAIVAGAQIGFGSIAFLIVQAGPAVNGTTQLLSGVAFAAGLMMVMVTGSELFTGNTMFALPAATGRLSAYRLALSWAVVWTGNLVGGIGVAWLFQRSGGLGGLDGAIAEAAVQVARDKLGKGTATILASGVLANMLVCLAVWMAMGARSLSATAAALVGPVAIFVAAGFEHSIANMSLVPIGLLAGAEGSIGDVARNLLLSTAGNIVGGAAVALALGVSHGTDAAES